MAVAVVERFKQELMYGLSAGTKKSGRYREVAFVERWPLAEMPTSEDLKSGDFFLSSTPPPLLHYPYP